MPFGRRRKPFHIKLKKATFYTFSSIGLLVAAGIIMLSFTQKSFLLARLYHLLVRLFGWGIICLPFMLIAGGLMLARLQWAFSQPNVFLGGIVLFLSVIGLFKSGLVGLEIWQNLSVLISGLGAFLVLLGFAFIGLVIIFNTSLEEIILTLGKIVEIIRKIGSFIRSKTAQSQFSQVRIGAPKPIPQVESSGVKESSAGEKTFLEMRKMPSSTNRNAIWTYPPYSLLLDSVSGKADRGDVNSNAEIIERTLESFGVNAHVKEMNYGPAVTQYALEIALGTKLSKITALSNDLALALAAPTGQIRIEAPIPGRSLVGVEVPNRSPEFVSLKRMLTSEKMKKSKSKLTVALGLDVSGQPVVTDIARMPHVLIAGATGSGKSVAINSFIASILYRATPDEVGFIMVDPKRVELTQYNGIPHLLSPVIVDPAKVIASLKWATWEMDRRYKSFSEVGVRNIEAYNESSAIKPLPYVVILIDELADIMLFSPAEVEDLICRIAQMARATGIHLVVSTQRPSVDVITGLIKANIPCRIAFNVSSQIDSRVIIDQPGAEKLLGRGDMLYIPPDQAKPTRIQGTYVSDGEIQKIIEFLRRTGIAPHYTEEVTTTTTVALPGKQTQAAGPAGEELDALLDESIQVINQYNRASASLLQRRLRVGYSRAARIIDQLEKLGIVGPAAGDKSREINQAVLEEHLAKQNQTQTQA